MRHLFIVNPVAGAGNHTDSLTAEIHRVFQRRKEPFEIFITRYPGHATELVRQAAASGEPLRFYACGGDGTLNEVANGAAGWPNAAITHWPTGTGNDFIRIFGRDAGRFRQLEQLLDCDCAPLDLICCGDRLGLNICSVGFDARIGTSVHKYSRLPLIRGRAAYNLSAAVNIIKGIHEPFRVELDGRVFDGRYTMLVCCNGRYYGGGFNPLGDRPDPADGQLDFLLVRAVSRVAVAGLIGKFSQGRFADYPNLFTHLRGRHMTVRASRTDPVNIDGECLLLQEFSFSLASEKVNLFFPRGATWKKVKNE